MSDLKARAEALWRDLGSRMDTKAAFIEFVAKAIQEERRLALEEAAVIAENSFPFAATDMELFAHNQTLRIAAAIRQLTTQGR